MLANLHFLFFFFVHFYFYFEEGECLSLQLNLPYFSVVGRHICSERDMQKAGCLPWAARHWVSAQKPWIQAGLYSTLTSCHLLSQESASPCHTTNLSTTPLFWLLRSLKPVSDSPGPVWLMPVLDGAQCDCQEAPLPVMGA